jgi:hypothetical protein
MDGPWLAVAHKCLRMAWCGTSDHLGAISRLMHQSAYSMSFRVLVSFCVMSDRGNYHSWLAADSLNVTIRNFNGFVTDRGFQD